MLEVLIEGCEQYDESTNSFIQIKSQTLKLEHSLLSISKWESRWHKPFVNKETKKKMENFNPFSLKSVRPSELKNKEKSKYKVGDVVTHVKFGKGRIKKVEEKSLLIDFVAGENKIATVLAEKLLT